MSALCPIYLINLPADKARRALMQQQLATLGLEAYWVGAVYGKNLRPAELESLYSPSMNQARYFHPLSPGEIGCYASHLNVWESVRAGPASMALVLEDDMVLCPELPQLLAAVAALPPHWDMVKLVGREREQVWRRWPLWERWGLVRYRRAPSLTGAYLISRDGAAKLAASRRPFYRPVDVDLRFWWESGLRLYGLWPYPAQLADSSLVSSIGEREKFSGLGYRWRKFRTQVHYSLYSLWANFSTRHQTPVGD